MHPKGVPAFIATSPPTVPGIPAAQATPIPWCSRASDRKRAIAAPAPSVNTTESPRLSTSSGARSCPSRITVPLTPRSPTIVFAPPPSESQGIPALESTASTSTSALGSLGRTQNFAEPPTRTLVRGASGAISITSPREARRRSARSALI